MNNIDYKEIDLYYLSRKSDRFRDWYKTALESRGYEILYYGGALDQKPWAMSLETWENYKSKWIPNEDKEYIEETCVTAINF